MPPFPPLPCTKRLVPLPLSTLHVMEAGSGPPLIMVPATISNVDGWKKMVQFIGQWFHGYFFELPGHGLSSPFNGKFSSHLVAELVEQLADALECPRFNLMGFSFGGILAMRAFYRLSDRIDSLILISPCLDRRTLLFSPLRLFLLKHVNRFLAHPWVQKGFYDLLHNRMTLPLTAEFLHRFGHVEKTIPLRETLPTIQPTTLAVLNAQIEEILTSRYEVPSTKSQIPCYFAMSIYDPLISFDLTLNLLQSTFSDLTALRLTYPFHQLPASFGYDELNRDFYDHVDAFMRLRQNIKQDVQDRQDKKNL
jgi:alpha/beta hydrolase fold